MKMLVISFVCWQRCSDAAETEVRQIMPTCAFACIELIDLPVLLKNPLPSTHVFQVLSLSLFLSFLLILLLLSSASNVMNLLQMHSSLIAAVLDETMRKYLEIARQKIKLESH